MSRHASCAARERVEPSLRILVLDTMLGWTGDHSRSQGEQVADLLEADGHHVVRASPRVERGARLVDMVGTMIRSRGSVDVASIAVFSGRAFRLAEVTSMVARLLRLPTILVLHGGALPEFAAAHPRRLRRLLDQAAMVVAPSPFNAGALAAYTERSIHVIPNVVQVDVATGPARAGVRPRILWMRALESLYAPEVALDVFAAVRARHPDARLTLAGPDKTGMRPALEAHIRELGLGDTVSLVGFLDEDAKRAAFGSHDVYLNTSRVDNTPVSLLEAAANGLTVVTSDPGGIPSLFTDGRDALICPVDDVRALADAVEVVLEHPDRAAELARCGQALAASMTWDALAPQWHAAFIAAHAGVGDRALP